MSKVVFIATIIFLLTACNKIERKQKQIEGEWKLLEYKYSTPTKLSYYYPATGGIAFDNSQSNSTDFTVDVDYTVNDLPFTHQWKGYIEFRDDEYFLMFREETGGNYVEYDNGRVFFVTQDDLIMIFFDDEGEHNFVLQR